MAADSYAHRILVVDEYRGWRVGVGNALVALGHEVWSARHGDEALLTLATLADSERAVDMLLTEVELGDMTGLELGRRVRTLCPAIRVIYMGYDDERRYGEGLLRKPFSLDMLEQAVYGAIHPRGATLRCA